MPHAFERQNDGRYRILNVEVFEPHVFPLPDGSEDVFDLARVKEMVARTKTRFPQGGKVIEGHKNRWTAEQPQVGTMTNLRILASGRVIADFEDLAPESFLKVATGKFRERSAEMEFDPQTGQMTCFDGCCLLGESRQFFNFGELKLDVTDEVLTRAQEDARKSSPLGGMLMFRSRYADTPNPAAQREHAPPANFDSLTQLVTDMRTLIDEAVAGNEANTTRITQLMGLVEGLTAQRKMEALAEEAGVDPAVVANPNVPGAPNAVDPNAVDPNAVDPNAIADPNNPEGVRPEDDPGAQRAEGDNPFDANADPDDPDAKPGAEEPPAGEKDDEPEGGAASPEIKISLGDGAEDDEETRKQRGRPMPTDAEKALDARLAKMEATGAKLATDALRSSFRSRLDGLRTSEGVIADDDATEAILTSVCGAAEDKRDALFSALTGGLIRADITSGAAIRSRASRAALDTPVGKIAGLTDKENEEAAEYLDTFPAEHRARGVELAKEFAEMRKQRRRDARASGIGRADYTPVGLESVTQFIDANFEIEAPTR